MKIEVRWSYVAAMVLVLVAVLVLGACGMTQEQQIKMGELQATVGRLTSELIVSRDAIDSLKLKIMKAKDRVASGDMSVADGFELVESMRDDIDKAKDHALNITKELNGARDQIAGLSESGVDWWTIGYGILTTVVAGYLKRGNVKLDGKLAEAAVFVGEHRAAIAGISRALRFNDEKTGMIADIKNLSNPLIEAVYHGEVKNG